MNEEKERDPYPPLDTPPKPIGDRETAERWLSEITGQPVDKVKKRLSREGHDLGITVREELQAWKIEPYEWTDRLIEFYKQSPAFMYETFVYNSLESKRAFRRRIVDYIGASSRPSQTQEVLLYGDALGLDSAFLARCGYRTSYYELGKLSLQFASRVFELNRVNVNIYERAGSLPQEAFDVVICLDVLEHVPDPPSLVRELAGYRRLGGRLIIHAPFWYIHPAVQTHLRSNLTYSGDLRRLYLSAGLRPIDAGMLWYPIVLMKDPSAKPVSMAARMRILTSGWLMKLSRIFPGPLVIVSRLLFAPKADKRYWSGA